MRKNQRVLNRCGLCYYNEKTFEGKGLVIAESDNVVLSYPIKTGSLCPTGDKDQLTHLILIPKQHFVSFLEIDEAV
jgi:hypothetical protein